MKARRVQVNDQLKAIRRQVTYCGMSEDYDDLRERAATLSKLAKGLQEIAQRAGIEGMAER